MDLFRLVYYSRSNLEYPPTRLAAEMANILSVSITNNHQSGVTGGLIYDRAWFVQALEGTRDAVEAVYRRIAADPRHHDLVVVNAATAPERRFPDRWMAGVNWCEAQAGAFLRLEEGFNPRMLAQDALLDLVEAMVHHPAAHKRDAEKREAAFGRRHALRY